MPLYPCDHYAVYDLYGARDEHASHDLHVALACVHCASRVHRAHGAVLGTDLKDRALRRGDAACSLEGSQRQASITVPGAGPFAALSAAGEGAHVEWPCQGQVTGRRPAAGAPPPRVAPPGWSAGAARGARTRRHPRTPRGGAGTGSRPAQEEELRSLVREARSQQSPRGVLGGVTRRRSALRAGSWPRSAGCPRVLAAPTPRNSTVRVNTAMRGLAGLACPFTRVLSQPRATLRGGALTTGAISGREADCACVADLMLILLEATVFSSMKTEVKRNGSATMVTGTASCVTRWPQHP